jgi:NhaP-type Na+/H+ or K+/H+ antiporter
LGQRPNCVHLFRFIDWARGLRDLLTWETDRETLRSLAEVTLALALEKVSGAESWEFAIKVVVEEIGIGLAVGLLLTLISVQLLKIAWQRNWLTPTWIQIPVAALALACFTFAQYLGGSGFIAAFSGGLLFGVLEKSMRDEFLRAAEGTGDTLALITWVIFGAAVAGLVLNSLSWPVFVYALLSLTVVRMLPVFLALTDSGVSTEGKLFVGWFGPRGLASIVFAEIVINSGLAMNDPIIMTVACTIILSILVHGISANPWARAYGKRRKLARQSSASKT